MKFKYHIRNMFDVYCHEFKLVTHDVGIMLFFMFLPFAYPIIYSLIYNPEVVRDVPIVIVDHDRSSMSRDMVRKLDACEQISVLGYAADLSEARHAMDSRDVFGIIEIPEGFQHHIGRNETANAVLYSDMSLLLRYRGFLVATTNVMNEYSTELLTEKIDEIAPLAETVAGGDLLPVQNISMGNIKNGFDSFIMPGVLILILQQCIILAVGMAGGAKHEGRLYTGYNSDNTAPSILLTMIAQMLCYLTILTIPIIFMTHFVPMIFKFPMEGNTLEIFAFLLPVILASFGVGYAFQAMVTEREAVFVLWVATSLLFLFLSGLIWPMYDIPAVWRWLAYLCPSTWGVEGFIKMNSNGTSLSQISYIYRNLWILTVGWWIVGYCANRWVVRPAVLHKAGIASEATGQQDNK